MVVPGAPYQVVYMQAAGGKGHVLGYMGRFPWFVFQGAVCSPRGLCSMGSGSVTGRMDCIRVSSIEIAWPL